MPTAAEVVGSRSTFHHLLVPLDGSALAECTLPFVAALAKVFSSRITLLRILESPGAVEGGQVDAVEWEMARAEAQSHLTSLSDELKAKGLHAEVEVLQGRAAEQIIQSAKQHQVDLIALSSHGASGSTAWPLGSTIQKVVARAHTSVLIVPAYATKGARIGERRFSKILLPLDCSLRAECMLPVGVALAHAHGAELILAHIVPEPEMPRRMPPSRGDLELAAQLTEHNRSAAERYLTDLQSHLVAQGVRAEIRIVMSRRLSHSLRDVVDREGIDLVVAVAHGSTADVSARYGGVADRLIQECTTPVIIVQDLPEAVLERACAARVDQLTSSVRSGCSAR